MAKIENEAALLIEEKAVAHVQAMALRLVDRNGTPRKQLANDMGVTESRVSQLFALEPKNLTIKSAARLFFHLGEELVFSCKGIEEMNAVAVVQNRERAAASRERAPQFEWCGANANDKAAPCDSGIRDVA